MLDSDCYGEYTAYAGREGMARSGKRAFLSDVTIVSPLRGFLGPALNAAPHGAVEEHLVTMDVQAEQG